MVLYLLTAVVLTADTGDKFTLIVSQQSSISDKVLGVPHNFRV